MTESLWSMGLAQFRDATASDAPTPGGGSAAMVSAAIGMGLVLMALRITARRADADRAALAPLLDASERLMAELSAHADADTVAFDGYMAALRLPKATEDEKAARRQALAEAAVVATEVPLNAAQTCLEGLQAARQAVDAAHRGIVSDVGAGAALLAAAAQAVLLNVDVNLGSIKDSEAAADYAASRRRLATRTEGLHRTILDEIARRLVG